MKIIRVIVIGLISFIASVNILTRFFPEGAEWVGVLLSFPLSIVLCKKIIHFYDKRREEKEQAESRKKQRIEEEEIKKHKIKEIERKTQERKKQDQKRKDGLIEKYGEKFGIAVFNKKTLKGMTLPMVEDILGKKKYNDENKYYFGKPFNRLINFADDKLDSDERLDKSIWLDMPKNMLVASWGKPAEEKEDISKDKVKLKWYFGARQTRQSTTVYRHEVRLEDDLVVRWRELE